MKQTYCKGNKVKSFINYKVILRKYGFKILLRKIGILKQKKILYLSCHSALEYDEVTLLRELGHYVFSPGDFVENKHPGKPWLRPFPKQSRREQIDAKYLFSYGKKDQQNKYALKKSFVDRFDIVIIMHHPKFIIDNWSVIKHKSVIWRTIGQSTHLIEKKLAKFRHQGLKVIRYSPHERNLHNFIGYDEIIRFYKNPKEFKGWRNTKNQILTIAQNMEERLDVCHFDIYKKVVKGIPAILYGSGNNDVLNSELTYKQIKLALKDFRCYFYTGTYPASYTLSFIEAWMTGIPIVAIGNKLMHDRFVDYNLYEVPELIKNGIDGYYADDISSLRKIIFSLMKDDKKLKKISKNGRKSAIKYFGKKNIKRQWEVYLDTL